MKPERFDREGKAALIKMLGRKQILLDSVPGCSLGLSRAFDVDLISEGLTQVTGIPFDSEKLANAADRTLTLERMYNVRVGMTRKDDTLPKRLLTEALPDGPAQGKLLTSEDLDFMLTDYYRQQGWDPKTGVPTPEHMDELGLSGIVDA